MNIIKRVGDIRRFYFNFNNFQEIQNGDRLVSLGTVVYSPNDLSLTIVSPTINNAPVTLDGITYAAQTLAYATVSAGTAGVSYIISVPGITSGGFTLIGENTNSPLIVTS